jgi:hypothetical protein
VDAKAQVIVACGVLEACIKGLLPHLINVGAIHAQVCCTRSETSGVSAPVTASPTKWVDKAFRSRRR